MRLFQWNPDPSARQLTRFGLSLGLLLPTMGWLWSVPLWLMVTLGGLGALAAIVGWLSPHILKPIFLGLMVVTYPTGLVVGEVLMVSVFVFVMVPIGLWFRLRGRDGLQRKSDRNASTYWQEKQPPNGPASYYRQW